MQVEDQGPTEPREETGAAPSEASGATGDGPLKPLVDAAEQVIDQVADAATSAADALIDAALSAGPDDSAEAPTPDKPEQAEQPEDVDAAVAAEMDAAGGSMEAILAGADAGAEQTSGAEASGTATDGETADGDEEAPAEAQHFEFKRGRISAIRGEDVFVDLTGEDSKMQGVVPLVQFERPPRLKSIMDFVVDREDEKQGLIFLSREGAVSRSTWDALRKGAVVEARVTKHNKGGLELELVGSIKAFMPASQIDVHPVGDLEQFVGQKMEAKVSEIDHRHKKVVLSRRAHLEDVQKRQRIKLLAELEVGQEREGTVTSVKDFGAFVDIGGMDGLVHVTDLSHSHVNKPKDVVKPGDKVRVKVLKIGDEGGRLSLGMKQVQPDPWEGLETDLTPGATTTGKITRTADFGAFVEVAPGVEGLLPISEMAWKRINKATDVVQVDQIVQLKVLNVDQEKKRLTLSLKQAMGDPWEDVAGKYAVDTWHDGTVTSIADFGAFVELEPNVEGLVHISELSSGRVGSVGQVLKVGDTKNFRVKSVDTKQRKLSLSLVKPAELSREEKAAQAERERRAAKRPKIDKSKLGGGMDLGKAGGIGLGGLSLDDFK